MLNPLLDAFLQGLFLQASLILVLGAQNLFVLDSGIKRNRQYFVATICAVCDTFLTSLGVLGFGSVFVQVPMLKIIFGVLGIAFLLYYGGLKLREAIRNPKIDFANSVAKLSARDVLLTTLSFSLLNPHVYFDTIVLIGGYSAKFSDLPMRLIFAFGASLTSWIWFFGLASLATLGNKFFHNQKAMRVVSFVSGLIMLGLALKLGHDVLNWILISKT